MTTWVSTATYNSLYWYVTVPGSPTLTLNIVEPGISGWTGWATCPCPRPVIKIGASRREDLFILCRNSPNFQTLTVIQELHRQFKLLVGCWSQVFKVWQQAWCCHVHLLDVALDPPPPPPHLSSTHSLSLCVSTDTVPLLHRYTVPSVSLFHYADPDHHWSIMKDKLLQV